MGKNFYAVYFGETPGIYDSWPAAQKQISGFPHACHKGFKTREGAEASFNEHVRNDNLRGDAPVAAQRGGGRCLSDDDRSDGGSGREDNPDGGGVRNVKTADTKGKSPEKKKWRHRPKAKASGSGTGGGLENAMAGLKISIETAV